ncbi:MAG: hypothetical protein GYB55_21355 [Cytophagales bacterium]|uniref:hypothetical protein n=1 Tax=Cyclobacterium TaxID=68288 RepID=UPI0019891FFC|nr:hypothetical protein [Cyclobacterium sp.]MBD3631004.1 hypothetical protein [Cyclobacterium sp.]MBR9777431.1 hypothetical protein [Cytophagales bacterium]|tara:strand:+ start:70009 stop:71226 length:1218 start_codon:yes stop_codon:yes gene_type:complete
MKTSSSIYKIGGYLLVLICLNHVAFAQKSDSSQLLLNMDAVYNRPFLQAGSFPVAIGGYIEAQGEYFVSDGITEGVSFKIPRMTLFVSSTITERIKFLSEIEFEEGTKEINIEFAALDFEFHPLLNFRGGIIMNPIGAFNQNHDGPRWEFVDRPISATTIIPATFSNVGFGLHGKTYQKQWVWAYEAYVTNGFNDRIVANSEGRTWLPATKENVDRFEENFNAVPLITLKTAIRHRKIGEIGLSWMGDVYNKYEEDGLMLDQKRRLDVLAIDFNTSAIKNLDITGEWVWAFVDVPATYSQQFGSQQQGGFIDFVYTVLKREMFGWENARINLALRLEHVDYNVGSFEETGGNIHDDVQAIVPALSFRPSSQTVIRANYRHIWETDLLGNPAAKTAGFQIGISSYF